ncbi:MAG: cytochrome c maturation protein CcmE [Gammaproteobacteria bacterium]
MTPKRKRRLGLIVALVIGVGAATGLMLYAMGQNVMYFYTPTEVFAGEAPRDRLFRVGGLVVDGSVERERDGVTVRFELTDTMRVVPVVYTGLLPDLFREGQGIVAHGTLEKDGVFRAQEVLAKHDENYMPPEVAASLKAAGGKHPGGAAPGYMPRDDDLKESP